MASKTWTVGPSVVEVELVMGRGFEVHVAYSWGPHGHHGWPIDATPQLLPKTQSMCVASLLMQFKANAGKENLLV